MCRMELKEALDVLLEQTLEIVLEFDEDGMIILGNRTAQEKLGYIKGIEGILLSDILNKDFTECQGNLHAVLERLKEKKATVMYRQNNTCFQAQVRVVEELELGRNFIFALDTEISREMEYEVIRTKEMAAQAMSARNDFVANVTHELRTPVNGIRGHVENLKDTYLTSEQRKTLDIIERCCNNMSSIINNILDFSKLESGKLELEEREFDLRAMIRHTADTNMAAVNEKGLQLSVNVDEDIPVYLIGDELRLSQILNNLLSNAVKFTTVGFIKIEVTVTLKFNDELELFFMVVDSGIGIAEEDQDKLFKSFTQVDSSITRKYGGTGLGLSITKELVELMNGKIYIESKKGRGSNFSFSVKLRSKIINPQFESYRKEVMQFLEQVGKREEYDKIEKSYEFGTAENKNEIQGRLEKLVLCIELGAWEKAEIWAGELKKLVETGGSDLKKAILRMEMAIRKENHDTSIEHYEKVKKLLEDNYTS